MLTKISKVNQTKLLKFITNPVINSTLVLTKKQSIECIEGTCKDCMFSSGNKHIELSLKYKLSREKITCYNAMCISLNNIYKLIEK